MLKKTDIYLLFHKRYEKLTTSIKNKKNNEFVRNIKPTLLYITLKNMTLFNICFDIRNNVRYNQNKWRHYEDNKHHNSKK